MSAVAASAAALALYYFLRNQRANVFSACGASPATTAPMQQEFGRHVEHAPRTWFEALEVLKEVLRMMYTETLGRWHTVDLFVGLAYLSNKEQLQFAASDIAAKGVPVNLQAPVEDCEALKVQLQEIRRYMLYCQGLKFKKAETQARFWIDNAGISPKQILVQQATAGLLRPAYVIIRDDVLRKVVLCIRGTKSMKDLFTSLSGATKPHHAVTSKGVTLGYGHLGMLAAARWLQRQVTPLLKEALEESGPDYTACIVGHSMGAGTAVMLTMMIRDVCPELAHVTCVAIACPACMTEELARSCRGFVTSVINGTDIVPTFCAASIDALREDVTASSWFAEFQKDLRASVVRAVSGGMRGIGSATQWTARNILSPAAYPLTSCYTRTTATCRPLRMPTPGTSHVSTHGAPPDLLIRQHQTPPRDVTDMSQEAGPENGVPMMATDLHEEESVTEGHISHISEETLEATLRSCLHAAQREVHVPGTAVPELVTEPLSGFTSSQAAEALLGNEFSTAGPSSRAGRNKAPRPNAPPVSPFQTPGQRHSHDSSPAHGNSNGSSPNRWWPWQRKPAQEPAAEPLLPGSLQHAQSPRTITRRPETDAGQRQGGFLGFLPNIFGGWSSPDSSSASRLQHGRTDTHHRRIVSENGAAQHGMTNEAQKQTTFVSTAGAGQQISRSWLINAMFAACMVPNRHRPGDPTLRRLGTHSRNPSLVDSLHAAGSPAGRPASLVAEEDDSEEDDEEVLLGDTDISGLTPGGPSEKDQQPGLSSRNSLQDQLQAGITAVVAAVTNEAENNWEDEEEGGDLAQEAETVLQETDMLETGSQPTTAISPAGIPTGYMSGDAQHIDLTHDVDSTPQSLAVSNSIRSQRHAAPETQQPGEMRQKKTLLENGNIHEPATHIGDSSTQAAAQPPSTLQPGLMDVNVDGYIFQAPATLPNQASSRAAAAGLPPGAGNKAAPQTVHRKLFPAGRILHFVPQHAMDALKAQEEQPQDEANSNQEDTSQAMSAPQPADVEVTHQPPSASTHNLIPDTPVPPANHGRSNVSSDAAAQSDMAERLQANATQPAFKKGDVVGAVGKIATAAQGPWVLLEVEDPTVYCRVKLCKTMVMDHFVSSYITALDSVVSQIDAHIETVSRQPNATV